MTIAIIIAGGSGQRMREEIPKQFIEVDGRPVIIYTLETFEKSPEIDAVAVVCVEGWQEALRAYAAQYGITKLRWVIDGGATAQESIRNGVFALEGVCRGDDIVVVHDGVRPMVEDYVLTDVLATCRKYGNAVTAMPYNEQIFIADDGLSTTRYIPRETLRRVSTPQAYRFALLDEKYHEAYEKKIGICGSAYANTMMVELGQRLYFAAGSDKNIKLTTQDDLALFKAYLKMSEEKA
ncbi:MAG: 2-C-methyl-D-erythritol 4-phosphate cytidylyltransferase [Oscillospiraceae bacterium]|nr:2-C-methyl-D-erythritol 4-phosphate cytidylyltransferase [Oscillospiraceae bacterium]